MLVDHYKKQFAAELNTVFAKLAKFDDRDRILWHYTSASGILGILESQSLFATQMGCLNDSSELGQFQDRIIKALSDATQLETDVKLKEILVDLVSRRFGDPTPRSPYYTTCLSRVENDLSQWRGYGNGENGFAIKFNVDDLMKWSAVRLTAVSVCYDQIKQDTAAKETVEMMLKFYRIAKSGNLILPEIFNQDFFQFWGTFLSEIGSGTKDPAFSNENEVRLMYRVNFTTESEHLKFLARTHTISNHFPITGKSDTADHKELMPIQEIMVGPSRYPENSKHSIRTILRKKGYQDNKPEVTLSKIPFRSI